MRRGGPRSRGRGRGRGRQRGGGGFRGRGRGRGSPPSRVCLSHRGAAPKQRVAIADSANPDAYAAGTKLYKLIRRGNHAEFEAILEELAGTADKTDNTDNIDNTDNTDANSDTNTDKKSSLNEDLDSKAEVLEDNDDVASFAPLEELKNKVNNKKILDYVINDWKGSQFHDTLLIIASYYNNPEIVKILLKYESNVNARDDYGRTALYWACRNDSLLVVSILLDHGADPNIFNKEDNTTTLWFAGFNGNIAIMKQLIKFGFDYKELINQGKDGTGYSVFHQVCEKGFLQCLKFLLKTCGSNAGNSKENNGGVGKSKKKSEGVIDIYLRTTNHNMNGLMLACNNSNVNVVKYLVNQLDYLSKDGVINEATVNGKTAVWYAAMDGNLEIIQLLCRRSSQVFKKDNELTTDPSKMNIINRIDLNKSNVAGHSPLYMASMRNHYDCVEWLVSEDSQTDYDYTIDVNLASKERMTPLMVATKCGNLKSVEVLSSCKNVKISDIRDKLGRNVFDYCAKFGQTNCLKIILKSLLSREQINTWTKLEESGIITIKTIESWMKIAKKFDKQAAMSSANAEAAAKNRAVQQERGVIERGDDAGGQRRGKKKKKNKK